MRLFYVSRYFVKEAISNLLTNRLSNIISVLIISFSLFTFGLFLLTAENLGRLVGQWTENIRVNAFLHKGLDGTQIARLETLIRSSPCVSRYQYISESEALKRFRSYYPGMSGLTEELDTNPFPPSFEITIRKEFQNRMAVMEFVNSLRAEPSVEDVEYDQDWINRVQFIIGFVRIIGLFFGGVLLFMATFSISNVIKLMILSRRDEIEIMRLVGATNSFIRGPFLAEGILQGFFGGTVAIVSLYAIFQIISAKVLELEAPFFSPGQLHFLPTWMILAIISGGMVAGFFGSLFSLGRFLKI